METNQVETVVKVVITHPYGTSVSQITDAVLDPMVQAINEADHWSAYTYVITDDLIADKATRTAFSLVLSEYPEDQTVDYVIDALERGSDEVLVWEPFEDWTTESIVNHINELAETIAEGMK